MCRTCYAQASFLIHTLVHTCPSVNYKFRLHTGYVLYELYTYVCSWLLKIDDRHAAARCKDEYTTWLSHVCKDTMWHFDLLPEKGCDLVTACDLLCHRRIFLVTFMHPLCPVPYITMGSSKMSRSVS